MRNNLQVPALLHFLNSIFLLIFSSGTVTLYAQTNDFEIFRDDFNRTALGSFWQANASWSIVNGSAYNFIDGTGGTLRTTAVYNEPSYIIETTAKGFTASYVREFRITFGQGNLSNDSTYVLKFTMYNGGKLTLSRSTSNIYNPKPLDEVAVYPDFSSTQWYKFKIAVYKSGLIQVYVDKGIGYGTIPLLETIDLAYGKLGHVGWQVDTQTSAESFYVDWITAYRPAIEKPAVREKPVEDNLITQVSAESGRSYKVSLLTTGVKAFTDRDYTITSVPSYLNGASFVQTAMDDKKDTSDNFLSMFIKKEAIVYIGYDPRGGKIPDWLSQWTKTTDRIGTTDPGSNYLEVYSRLIESMEVYPYPLLLGGNLASPAFGAEMNYLVAAIERPNLLPLQAENAFVSGAAIANNHVNYHGTGFVDFINPSNDYIEWTVLISVPGTYNIGFRYANGALIERPLQIKHNGANLATLSFYSTLSWSSWAFLSGPDVFLSTGVHKIRATTIGFGGPNMDELSLFYSSSSAANAAPGKYFQNAELISHSSDQSHKAYPNPFVENTKIYYSLKEKANVSLSVYSIKGQQLQLLVNEHKKAGNYQATFNAGEVAPGIYFYRLQIGNEVKVGKLIKE